LAYLWALKYEVEVMGWFDGAFVSAVGCINCWLGSFVGLELVGGVGVGSDAVSSQ
jgi:hypothetical protein